jgi:hypothetical protein
MTYLKRFHLTDSIPVSAKNITFTECNGRITGGTANQLLDIPQGNLLIIKNLIDINSIFEVSTIECLNGEPSSTLKHKTVCSRFFLM